jgi:hypothetical protein
MATIIPIQVILIIIITKQIHLSNKYNKITLPIMTLIFKKNLMKIIAKNAVYLMIVNLCKL